MHGMRLKNGYSGHKRGRIARTSERGLKRSKRRHGDTMEMLRRNAVGRAVGETRLALGEAAEELPQPEKNTAWRVVSPT